MNLLLFVLLPRTIGCSFFLQSFSWLDCLSGNCPCWPPPFLLPSLGIESNCLSVTSLFPCGRSPPFLWSELAFQGTNKSFPSPAACAGSPSPSFFFLTDSFPFYGRFPRNWSLPGGPCGANAYDDMGLGISFSLFPARLVTCPLLQPPPFFPPFFARVYEGSKRVCRPLQRTPRNARNFLVLRKAPLSPAPSCAQASL